MLDVLLILATLAGMPFPQPSIGEAPPAHIVRVFVLEKGARSAGSGSLVAPDLILTCNHVVKDREKDVVEVMFGNWDVVTGKVLKVDTTYDLALIKLDAPRAEAPATITSATMGDDVTINGFGYGPYLAQKGIYKERDKDNKWGIVKGAQARSGDSGGPVMHDGKVVGVLWGASEGWTWFTAGDELLKTFPELRADPMLIRPLFYDL